MKRIKLLTVFLLIPTLSLLTSCRRPATSSNFSNILNEGFDPGAAFRQSGYTVHNTGRGESIKNRVDGYGWTSWCGIVGASDTRKEAQCEALAVIIRDELNKALSGNSLDELTGRPLHPEQPSLTGMLRYNKDNIHGDVYVWLTPDLSNAAVSYVIFVREDRLQRR